jgi:ectoine hydroxylase-related dioxygenase (phytanoyl-CoA dioxygenase family)
MFKKKQVIYSSLFFREGTKQHYHRDTPHFYTNPIDTYYGVWYALEDVNINAGPLKYYIGSHKLECSDGHETFNNLLKSNPDYNIISTDVAILSLVPSSQ